MSEWISVKERLPELDKMIIFTDGKQCYCGQYEWDCFKFIWVIAEPWIENSKSIQNTIHWMPLPSPPENE